MIVYNDRLVIKRGSDYTPIFKLRGKYYNNPMDLTGVFNITIQLDNANRTKAVYDMTPMPASKAYFEENSIKLEAEIAGALGNNIVLVFDGVKTVKQVVDSWNLDNEYNKVIIVSGSENAVITGKKRFWGGLDSYSPVQIDGNPLLGRIKLILSEIDTIKLKRGDNQSVKITVDFGAPPSGSRKIAILEDRLDVIDR
jgi:hypothetical protein